MTENSIKKISLEDLAYYRCDQKNCSISEAQIRKEIVLIAAILRSEKNIKTSYRRNGNKIVTILSVDDSHMAIQAKQDGKVTVY